MKTKTFVYLLALGCLSLQACSNGKKATDDSIKNAENVNEQKEDQGSGLQEDDSEFAVKAASGGLVEVELAHMVAQKAQNPAVKAFGAQMLKDHTKDNAELKALAERKHITLPTTPGKEQQEDIDRLNKLTGAEFDKQYISYMKDDHQEDVKDFKKGADEVKDADLKAYAVKTLPILQMHLNMVTALDKQLN